MRRKKHASLIHKIMSKQIYNMKLKGGRSLTRPPLTVYDQTGWSVLVK